VNRFDALRCLADRRPEEPPGISRVWGK
jgi:hypothetical protein